VAPNAQSDNPNPTSISISIADNEIASAGLATKNQKTIDETKFNLSSEQTA
jgi:hypothetical protein